MRKVDTRGLLCPAPLIAAKRALKETEEGGLFELLTDNRTSYDNLIRFLKDNKTEVSVVEESGLWRLTIRKTTGQLPELTPEAYCEPEIAHFEKGDFIIVISSDRMGEGDEELGRLLAANFIKAIKDLDTLPGKILFYNSGVKLAVKGSLHVGHLNHLEQMGVEILLCSTCVNHYGLEGKTGAGTLSNIFTIAQEMASAPKIIKP